MLENQSKILIMLILKKIIVVILMIKNNKQIQNLIKMESQVLEKKSSLINSIKKLKNMVINLSIKKWENNKKKIDLENYKEI